MKDIRTRLLTLTLLLSAVLGLAACSSSNDGVTEEAAVVETADGAAVVDTMKASATVTAIDAPQRKVTLRMANGKQTTVTCGPDVANFDQIEVNDKVNVTVTDELAVYLGRGSPPSASGAAGVALAPIGAKPGGVMAQTVQITAKITAIDAAKRQVTLALPDGSTKTVKAGKQIDLSSIKGGDDVTVQHTEAVAITVEKA